MILLIDNYDSFVYNLARYAGRLGCERRVVRNDGISLEDVEKMNPAAIIISPGPRAPADAGISRGIIERFHRTIPLLGICLGHQSIGEVFGGQTVRAPRPVHGRASPVIHDGTGLFSGLPSPVAGARYHALTVDLPAGSPLRVTARAADDGTIMGIAHDLYPVHGLQFHPESVLTSCGEKLLKNFLAIAGAWNGKTGRAAA